MPCCTFLCEHICEGDFAHAGRIPFEAHGRKRRFGSPGFPTPEEVEEPGRPRPVFPSNDGAGAPLLLAHSPFTSSLSYSVKPRRSPAFTGFRRM